MIKNLFANKYHYTPKQVDEMDAKTIMGFMTLEKARDDQAEAQKKQNEAKSRIKNYGR
jgi:hypothetical protein